MAVRPPAPLGPTHTQEFHLYFEETKQMTHPCPHKRTTSSSSSYQAWCGLHGSWKKGGEEGGKSRLGLGSRDQKWKRQGWHTTTDSKTTNFIRREEGVRNLYCPPLTCSGGGRRGRGGDAHRKTTPSG